jgi:hypothetical protein
MERNEGEEGEREAVRKRMERKGEKGSEEYDYLLPSSQLLSLLPLPHSYPSFSLPLSLLPLSSSPPLHPSFLSIRHLITSLLSCYIIIHLITSVFRDDGGRMVKRRWRGRRDTRGIK